MLRLLVAVAAALLAAGPAAAASPLAEVIAPSGRVLVTAETGGFAYPEDGSVLRIGDAAVTGAGVDLHDVAILGGQIIASRVFVPAHGSAARVDGLFVEGKAAPVRVNGLLPLGGYDYLITSQAAVSSNGTVGRVGLRLTLGDGAFGVPAGTQIVVGLPAAPPPRKARRLAAARATPSPLNVLGFTGQATAGLTGFVPAPFVAANGSLGEQAVALAERYLGVPYLWGGGSPITGFDCSGLVQFVYGQLGVRMTHYTGAQYDEGVAVTLGQLRPGDLVFFEPSFRGPQHVGIYAGNGQFIHAPHTGDVVKISSLSEPRYAVGFVGAVRPYAP